MIDARKPWQRSKWTFASGAFLVTALALVASRLTGGSADVERDLVMVLGAIGSLFLGGQSFVDARHATVSRAISGLLGAQPKAPIGADEKTPDQRVP